MRLSFATGLAVLCLATAALAGPPEEPRVLNDIPKIGRPGGELRSLIGRPRDTRLFFAYGHARLVGYDLKLELVPDILASYEVQDGRIFTFHLRKGHRWSDGEPFTAEDFRFYWEDVAQNPELSPTGPEVVLLVDGEKPKVEILDERTVRYSWSKPNPLFLPAIAATTSLEIYRPAHYLRQFHKRYADPAKLDQLVKETRSRDWVQLYLRKDRLDDFDNPDMPTLQPWMPTTAPPAERFVAVRNPYFHRVDETGQQLPYLDRFILVVADPKLIPLKTGAGETDLQARHLAFKDYTFLKESEERSSLRTLLWPEGRSAHLALYPNLNAKDPVWRKLFRDRRFREALSLGIDRETLSQYLYFGLARPSNNSLLAESPLYRKEYGERCTAYDPDAANRILDELGLKRRGSGGVRLLPDGRPMELVVETAGEDAEQADVLELVRDQWQEIGLKIHTKPSEREVLRNRIFAGETLMSIFYGIDNGTPTVAMPPKDFAPTSQADQPQWPKWGQYHETRGEAGEPPDLPEAKELLDLYQQWERTADPAGQRAVWERMLDLYTQECFTFGLVENVRQPLAVRANLRNVPEEAIFNWEPQGQIGLYRPDTFFYDK
ncbi:ABC transporter substrate-binding protein [Benzoatithermus flavus]|uniref:ABC transporter substrate-binding protein n=1 Tax=Benzoatithermus flavus TaxID=3108223 RepID=A0ABU8XRD4_9PROT